MVPPSVAGTPRTTAQYILRAWPTRERLLRSDQGRLAQRDDKAASGVGIQPMRKPRPVLAASSSGNQFSTLRAPLGPG